jgi:exopolyphosphatase / guanosine-5'-triphosphate,3'-diphosphate pyrophosphatase
MLTLASIDVGSNTIRLLIGAVEDERIADIHSARRITRLGNKVNQTGILQDKNMEDSIAVLKEFSSAITHYGAHYTKAVGTSALREATNADLFIKKAFEETGIMIEVISGEQEAALTLKGILASLSIAGYSIPESALIVDMGGGSTEWISIRKKHAAGTSPALIMGTIPMGVIRLAQKYVPVGPVSEYDVQQMAGEIDPVLLELNTRIGDVPKETCLIGTAGTFTTIASVDLGLEQYSRERIHLHPIPFDGLLAMKDRLFSLTLKERETVKGLEPGRADLIIPGIQFTISMMKRFRIDELTVSDHGLLEGALLSVRETFEKSIPKTGKS